MKSKLMFLVVGFVGGVIAVMGYLHVQKTGGDRVSHLDKNSKEKKLQVVSTAQRKALITKNNDAEKIVVPVAKKASTENKKAPTTETLKKQPEKARQPISDVVDSEELYRLFPGNLALPALTKETMEQKRAAKKKRDLDYGKIAANKASTTEIKAYYDQQQKLSVDSIVLLEYVLSEYREKLNEKNVKKHEFLLSQFKKRLEAIPDKEAQAIARLKTVSNGKG